MNASVWTVDATQKIFQDKAYDAAAASKRVTVSAAKNEYEGWQVILSAAENSVDFSYEITASDLTSADGQSVYEAENISFFHELYMYVSPKEYYTHSGYYPDAILPMDKAVEYKENIVKAGGNQGIYAEFYIPAEQETGVYTGSFTVKLGTKTTTVPVTLEVWDYTVSEKTTAKSLFLTKWDQWTGELDTSQQMYQAYIDALLDYRLCTNDLLFENDHSEKCIAQYTELAYQYAADERCSTISIPFKRKNTSVVYPYMNEDVSIRLTFDEDIFKQYVQSFAQKSVETGVNILDKCAVYFTIIDEPQLNRSQARVKYVSERFAIVKQELADSIRADETLSTDAELRNALADSVLKISNVVTTYYEEDYEGYKIDYCPTPDHYDSDVQRAHYADNERWWYCCVGPNNPYPTYHIDDHLISTRLLYWMASEYGVVGNLNWAVNSYSVYGEIPEDFYKYAVHNSSQNGEGFVFYPGAKYGIYGPVASLRLQAYRDGIEEYEMMNTLKEKYAEISKQAGYDFGAQNMIEKLTDTLYSGTRWNTTEDNFYQVRSALSQISQMALCSQTEGAYLADIEEFGYTLQLKVFALDGTNLFVGDKNVTELPYVTATQYTGGKLYEIRIDKSTFGSRTLTIGAEINGVKRCVSFDLGGEVSVYNAADVDGKLSVYNNTNIQFEKVSASGIGGYTSGELIKFTLGNKADTSYSVVMQPSFLNALHDGTAQMEIVLYTDKQVTYEISFLYKQGSTVAGRPIYNNVATGVLSAGENAIKINNLNSYNWSKYVGVQNILITFKTADNESQVVYLREIVLTGV